MGLFEDIDACDLFLFLKVRFFFCNFFFFLVYEYGAGCFFFFRNNRLFSLDWCYLL
jgi:hypothetical protein